MCIYCSDVAELIWKWYCREYRLVSNAVTAFEYECRDSIRVPCMDKT